jgi:hypothetical protein
MGLEYKLTRYQLRRGFLWGLDFGGGEPREGRRGLCNFGPRADVSQAGGKPLEGPGKIDRYGERHQIRMVGEIISE